MFIMMTQGSNFTHDWQFNHHYFLFQYLMSDMNPSSERRTTRATNAGQHPGHAVIGIVRKRRTKEEMARDKALLAVKKAEENLKKVQGIARIAELEDRMAIDDAGAGSAHPRNHKGSCLVFALLSYELLI